MGVKTTLPQREGRAGAAGEGRGKRVSGTTPRRGPGSSPIHCTNVVSDDLDMETSPAATRRRQWLRIVRVLFAISTVVGGGTIVLVTAVVGHCSAFGGRCPDPSAVNSDVLRGAAMGTMLAVGGALWMRRPSWRGLLRAVVIAALVAIPASALVMAATQG